MKNLVLISILSLIGCSKPLRWPASPAQQLGVRERMQCYDGLGPITKQWTARFVDDTYWCYEEDEP